MVRILLKWCVSCRLFTNHRASELLSKDNSGNKQIDIGTPYNAKHITHVGFDAKSGQFTGLPPDWQILLKHSGITETEQKRHPQVTVKRICPINGI